MKHTINIKPKKTFNKKVAGFIEQVLKHNKKLKSRRKNNKTKKRKNKTMKNQRRKTRGGKDNKIIVNVALSKEQDPYITVDGIKYPSMINMFNDWFGGVEDFMGILMDSEDVKRNPASVETIEITFDKKNKKSDVKVDHNDYDSESESESESDEENDEDDDENEESGFNNEQVNEPVSQEKPADEKPSEEELAKQKKQQEEEVAKQKKQQEEFNKNTELPDLDLNE